MRATATENYGTSKKNKKEDTGSFLDNFISSGISGLKNIVEGIGNSAIGKQLQQPVAQQTLKIADTVQTFGEYTQTPEGKKTMQAADVLTSPIIDPLLNAANVIEWGWSNLIARPASTIAILTQKDSTEKNVNPLKAWDRSEEVSFGQAAPTSWLFTNNQIGRFALTLASLGGNSFSEIDVWDDKSIKAYYEDSPTGKIFSGSIDLGLNLAGGAAIDGGARALAKAVGLATKITKVEDLAQLETQFGLHQEFINTAGASGQRTTYGAYVETLANTKSAEEAAVIVSRFSNNNRLVNLVTEVDNPEVISNMILADKGYLPAVKKLMDTDPDVFYTLGDMQSVLATRSLYNPTFQPVGTELENLQKAYDVAIQRNPVYKEVWDTFMDQSGMPRMLGNDWKPATNKFVESFRLKFIEKKMDIKTGISDSTEPFISTTLGSKYVGGPVTVLMKQAISGLPKGYFRVDPTRFGDNIDEIASVFDSMKLFRNNKSIINVELAADGTYRTATVAEVRQSFINRFAGTKPQDMPKFVDQFDEEIGRLISLNTTASEDVVLAAIKEARRGSNSMTAQLRDRGFYFDEIGNRVVFEPAFTTQLADVVPMLPWATIERNIAYQANSNALFRAKLTGQDLLAAGFNFTQRVFSTNILVTRPAYTLKNAIAAPLTDELMYFGRIVTDGGAGNIAKRWASNRRSALIQRVQQAKLRLPKSKYKVISKEINQLTQSLDNLYAIRDTQTAEYYLFTKGSLSPVVAKKEGKSLIASLEKMDNMVRQTEKSINDIVPNAISGDTPTLYELWRRLEYIKTQAKRKPQVAEVQKLEQELNDIVQTEMGVHPNQLFRMGDLDVRIKESIDKADAIIKRIAGLKELQAEELMKVLPYKIRKMSYEDTFVGTTSMGTKVTIDDLFADTQFGSAMRAEFSAGVTQQLTMTNEIRLAAHAGRFNRLTGHGTIRPTDPEYFEQLAYYINRFMRNDEFVKRYIGTSTAGQTAGKVEKVSVGTLQKYYDDTLPPKPGEVPIPDGYIRVYYGVREPITLKEIMDSGYIKMGQETVSDPMVFLTTKPDHYSNNTFIEFAFPKDAITEVPVNTWDGAAPPEGLKWFTYSGDKLPLKNNAIVIHDNWHSKVESLLKNNAGSDGVLDLEWGTLKYIREGRYDKDIKEGFDLMENPLHPIDMTYLEQTIKISNAKIYNYIKNASEEELQSIVTPTVSAEKLSTASDDATKFEELVSWAMSKAGIDHFESLGIPQNKIGQALMERVNHLDRYVPNDEVRTLMMQQEVDAATLQSMMAGQLEELTTITSTDFDGIASIFNISSSQWNKTLSKNIKAFEQKLFTTFATRPEDAIARFPGGAELFRANMMRRMNLLEEQGLPVGQYNAVRQAAAREALADVEKIYYSIPRQNRAVLGMRLFFSFPQASINTARRYARFALENPGRAVIGLQAYRDTYEQFGVDKYGNRVPIMESRYIVIPFSQEIQTLFGVKNATGLLIPRNGLNYIINNASGSWLAAVGTKALIANKPENEETFRTILGEQGFELLFPGGYVSDNWAETFVSGWQKDAYDYLNSDESNEDWLLAVNHSAQYLNSEWERGGKLGDKPTVADIEDMAKDWYLQKAAMKFFVGFGVQVPAPGQAGRDVYYALLQKNNYDTIKTREQMVKKFGKWSTWYTASTSETSAVIPATQEAYRRIWVENNDLARKLAEIDIESPEVVSVLVADVEGDFSSAVYNWLMKAEIPGTSTRIKRRLTLEQFEKRKKVSDGWDDYIASKRNIDAALASMGRSTMPDRMKQEWDYYVHGEDPTGEMKKEFPDVVPMKKQFPEWYDDFASGYTSDTGYKWAKALHLIVNDKKFWSKNGKKPFWKTVVKFMNDREQASRYVDDPAYSATAVREDWKGYVLSEFGTPGKNSYNEKFYNFYLRYLENDMLEGI